MEDGIGMFTEHCQLMILIIQKVLSATFLSLSLSLS